MKKSYAGSKKNFHKEELVQIFSNFSNEKYWRDTIVKAIQILEGPQYKYTSEGIVKVIYNISNFAMYLTITRTKSLLMKP